MSTDELLVTIAAVAFGPVRWGSWLSRMMELRAPRQRTGGVVGIVTALVVSALSILIVLKTSASSDVVNAPEYLFMYVVVGLAWLMAAQALYPYLGLSPRDDVFERGNLAARPALIGAMAGVTFCYAGANVGEGPGWWVVVFCAGLATAGLMASWFALGQVTSVTDAVTIDRDLAAGIRLGAYLSSCGLILGRSAAGNWESASATIVDFGAGLPVLAFILLLAAGVEHLARPTVERPHTPVITLGVLPATLYLAIAIAAVVLQGWPA